MIINKKNNRSTMQPPAPAHQPMNNYNNSFNETDQYFNDFSQLNNTGYSTSTQHHQPGICY